MEEAVTEGVLPSCPFIHWPKPDPLLFDSPISASSWSRPSISGVNVSPNGLRLPDLAINAALCWAAWWLFFRQSKLDIIVGDPVRAELLACDLDVESPRTTSSFSAEKKPYFLSIVNGTKKRRSLEWKHCCCFLCLCLFGGGGVVMEVAVVDFGCWLVSRGFTTVGLRVRCFGSAVYMGVWAVCSGHGELDFGVRLSRWLLVFWRWMGFCGLLMVALRSVVVLFCVDAVVAVTVGC